jgi:hypothetical protein
LFTTTLRVTPVGPLSFGHSMRSITFGVHYGCNDKSE